MLKSPQEPFSEKAFRETRAFEAMLATIEKKMERSIKSFIAAMQESKPYKPVRALQELKAAYEEELGLIQQAFSAVSS